MSYFGMCYECMMSTHCRAIPNTHSNRITESESLGVKQRYPIVFSELATLCRELRCCGKLSMIKGDNLSER